MTAAAVGGATLAERSVLAVDSAGKRFGMRTVGSVCAVITSLSPMSVLVT